MAVITDGQIREELEAGLSGAQIAAKYGVSRQAVAKRVNRIKLTTAAVAVVAPTESRRYVADRLDAMEEMARLTGIMRRLLDAYVEWAKDAEDPQKFDLGPRANEVMVTYWDFDGDGEKPVRMKASLQELLARIDGTDLKCRAEHRKHFDIEKSESKIADPRVEIRAAVAEMRQLVNLAVQMAQMLADARTMQTLREAILAEIESVEPEVAGRIAMALRQRMRVLGQ